MGAALGGEDVVGEAHDGLGVGGVPLDGHLNLAHLCRVGGIVFALEVDGLLEAVGDLLALVQELDEVDDAAGVAELVHARGELALVGEGDLEAAVQERHLLEAVVQGVVVVDRGLEDVGVGPEGDRGACGLGLAHDLHLLGGLAAGKGHLVDVAVAAYLHHELAGEGVHDGAAHTMEAAGDLVGRVVELAAGVQDREDDLKRRDLLGGVLVDRDASAVVGNGDRVVCVDGHGNLAAEAGKRLVDGVVDNLVDQVVQAARARRADVHARTLANRVEALENLDLATVVGVLLFLGCHPFPFPRVCPRRERPNRRLGNGPRRASARRGFA